MRNNSEASLSSLGLCARVWIPQLDDVGHAYGPECYEQVSRAVLRRIRHFTRQQSAQAWLTGPTRSHCITDQGPNLFAIDLQSRPSIQETDRWVDLLLRELKKPIRLRTPSLEILPLPQIGLDISRSQSRPAVPLKAEYSLRETTASRPVCIYKASLQRRKKDQIQLESEIRMGLKRHEFISYFQPKVDPQTGAVAGAEALVRWHRPGHGTVFPPEFIKIAERSELIHEIGQSVADQTVGLLSSLKKQGKNLPVAINLSDRDLDHEDLLVSLRKKLDRHQLEPNMVTLEVSEKIAAIDDERHFRFFDTVARVGFNLSLDDFGTAYSCLARMTHLPITEIKLDRFFLRQANHSKKGRNLLISVAQMLLQNDYRVTLEGIEKGRDLKIMKALPGCLAQGFFFSPAIQARDFKRMVS